MDIFDASDFDFLLPRSVRKFVALSLLVGVAIVPPVQRWYMGQIEQHAQHITRNLIKQLTPKLPAPKAPSQ